MIPMSTLWVALVVLCATATVSSETLGTIVDEPHGVALNLLQRTAKALTNVSDEPDFVSNPAMGSPAFPDGGNHVLGDKVNFLGVMDADCSNPPGVTCQCDWNPDYQCRLAWGDQCYCFSHSSQFLCENAGGYWCVRPTTCVDNCELCSDENACAVCQPGYMAVYGQCTMDAGTEEGRWLKAHNILRCMHGSEQLSWSQAAADSAKVWADHMVQTGWLAHSNSYNEPPPAGPAGENLAFNYGSPESATSGWYSEVECCDSLPGCQAGTCVTGHFTAMVWAGVSELGCATSGAYQVCRYRSGDAVSGATANMANHYRSNVLPQSRELAACIGDFDSPATTTTTTTISATTTIATLPSCSVIPKNTRGECETCIKTRDCAKGFRCHNKYKRCVNEAEGSTCKTPKAGCSSTCTWKRCTNKACDCECDLVGEMKDYDWLVWQNLANSNSKSPSVTCVQA